MKKIDDEAAKPKTPNAKPSSKWTQVLGILAMLPTILWWLVCASGASFIAIGLLGSCLPSWGAIVLGVIIGVVLGTVFAFVAASIIGGGASTVLELNVSSCILLVLTGIIAPVFMNARHKAQEVAHRQEIRRLQKTES